MPIPLDRRVPWFAAVFAVYLITGADIAVAGRSFPDLTAAGQPNVQSEAAVVIDADNGATYYAKNADQPREIASTGKIFVALVARALKLDLDGLVAINRTDARFARGGARTRLELHHAFTGRDLLRAMLIASDNRAPTALGRAVGLSADQLVGEVNQLARRLGLRSTHFTGPAGLRTNTSTAREMALALGHTLRDPVLAGIMATREVSIRSVHSRPKRIVYRNTNRALMSGRYPVTGGKTGYTAGAGYCLIISARIGGRTMLMAFLGTREKLTRYGDFTRVVKWLAAGNLAPETGS